ncbi:MAG: cytochrome c biogenesis protein ResB [Planctomycetota bacterium]
MTIPNSGRIPFLFVHGGLLIVFSAMIAGRPLIERGSASLRAGREFSSFIVMNDGSPFRLPFEMRLREFTLESWPPAISGAVRDNASEDNWRRIDGTAVVSAGKTERIETYDITVERVIPNALMLDGTYVPTDDPTAPFAAFATVSSQSETRIVSGWLTTSSPREPHRFLHVGDNSIFFLSEKKPRRYESIIEIRELGKQEFSIVRIAVNHPYSFKGWALYQSGYRRDVFAREDISTIEAVRDPSYPFVFSGALLTLAGAVLYGFRFSRKTNDNDSAATDNKKTGPEAAL